MESYPRRLFELMQMVLFGNQFDRNDAQDQIEKFKRERPEELLDELGRIYLGCEEKMKKLACVIFRQILKIESFLSRNEMDLRNFGQKFCEMFLDLLRQEKKELQGNLICCVVELFEVLAAASCYDGFFDKILELMRETEDRISSGLRILSEICTFVHPSIFQMRNFFSGICKKCLESDCFYIRSSSVKFTCKYLEILNENEINEFREMWELVISYLKKQVKKNSKETIQDINELRDLAEANPSVFKFYLKDIVEMIDSVRITGVDELNLLNCFYQLIEFTLSSIGDELLTNFPSFAKLIDSIFEFMSYQKLLFEEDWLNPEAGHNEDDLNDSTEIDYSRIGANYISNIVNFLGESSTLPYIFSLIDKYFSSNCVERINSALLILNELPQYTDEKSHFSIYISRFPSLLQEPNPKIASSVLNCITSLSENYSEQFTETFHELIMNDLLNLLNSPTARLVNDALKSLKSFFSHSGYLLFSLYKSRTLSQLLNLLNHVNSSVQNECLGLLIVLCNLYSQQLQDWQYPIFNSLNNLIFSNSLLRVRGKALEAASVICVKIESQSKKALCQQLMKLVLSAQEQMIEQDSAMRAFVLSVWQILAPILGVNISEYIEGILSVILAILEGNQGERSLEGDSKSDGKVNSTCNQEIVNACEALMIISNNLRVLFSPFLVRTTKDVLNLLDSKFSSGVQESAAVVLPVFIQIFKESGQSDPIFIREILKKLWDQVSEEYDKKLQSVFIGSIKSSLENFQENWMTCEEFQVTSKNLITILKNSFFEFKAVSSITSNKATFPEEIDELNVMISELLSTLMKTHKNYCSLLAEDITTQLFSLFLNPEEPAQYHKAALFIMDDMIENLDFLLLEKYWDPFFQSLNSHALHPDPEVRQAAYYGIGLMMQKSPRNFFKTQHLDIINLLKNATFSQVNQGKKNVYAKENAFSALLKFFRFQGQTWEIIENFQGVVESLPIIYDKEEAKVANDLICEICFQNFELIFDRENNVERAFKVFAVVLDTQLCEVLTIRKIQAILKRLVEKYPVFVEKAFEDLSELHQRKLKVLLEE